MTLQSRSFQDRLSPGVKYILFDTLPAIVKPVVTVLVGYQLAVRFTDVDIPPQLLEYIQHHPVLSTTLASGGLALVTSIAQSVYRSVANERERRALGAVHPPWAKAKLPLGIDILKTMLYKWDNGYLGEGFGFLLEDYNEPFVGFTALGENRIITSEPWFVKSVVAGDFESYEKGDIIASSMSTVLGVGIFSTDGDLWKFHRGMSRPFFSRNRLSDLEVFDRHSAEVMSQIRKAHEAGQPFDFQELIMRFTLDSATEFLFGDCVHSLKSPLPLPGTERSESSDNRFVDSFAAANYQMCLRIRAGKFWPLAEFFQDKTKYDNQVINDYIEPILKTALAKKRARKANDVPGGNDEEEHQTLLDSLVSRTDDIKLIRDELVNILIAGRDTTAGTLAFIVYLLSQDPEVFAKLRQEVLNVVGKTAQPSLENIKEMKYMKAVINETLRLYPAVPVGVKTCVRNTTVTNPETGKKYFIEKDTVILEGVSLMHVRKDIWGPDADQFIPERWIDERREKVLKNPFMHVPFNAGPRICLGQQFAINEMAFFMARLLQNFDQIEFAPEAFPPGTLAPPEWKKATGRKRLELVQIRSNLTIYIAGGMWVKMRPATNNDESTE